MNLTKPDPEKAGFDHARLARVVEILNEGSERELYPGGVLWVARKGVTALVSCSGHTDFARDIEVDEGTLFDLASLTKPLATAPSILLLCRDGAIHLEQKIGEFFPEIELPHLTEVTLRHLLTHTSGLPAAADLYSNGQSREQAIAGLFDVQLCSKPGTIYKYSCLGYLMLGLVAEVVAEESLDLFTYRRIFGPLGMTETVFNPEPGAGHVIAITDNCPLRNWKLLGEVHDPNAFAFGGIAGNAGLFSTSRDLAIFCHNLMQPGGNGPFGPAMLNKMFLNAISNDVGGHTLGGWFISPNEILPACDLASSSTVGHSGFTGTAIILDPEYELCSVLLTNRVCRKDDGTQFRHLRRRLFNAVLGAIVC